MSRLLPITSIESGSAAARAGLRAGDRIRSMNGVPLRDVLDLRFEGAEEEIEVVVENGDGRSRTLVIERRSGEVLGIETEEMKARTCANDCVFCFIDQMPRGRRRGLYVRDEDFRYSFLHGNYVTLTNLREQDLARVIEQGLSPLYVSVHATDPAVRARLLGLADAERAAILPVLDRLLEGGIHVHGQIVVCPGWNDGAVLDETIETLAARYPGVDSVAVVPLGQTDHRQGLAELIPVTAEHAGDVVTRCQAWQERLRARCGRPFVYLADEWYFLTGTSLPAAEHYQGFPQLEDGVGMARHFIDHLRDVGEELPIVARVRGRQVTVVTGVMAAPLVREHLVDGLLARHAAEVDLVAVENRFLGSGITVSGLLGGDDIRRALEGRAAAGAARASAGAARASAGAARASAGAARTAAANSARELILLPPNCVNGRALFLDDLSLTELRDSIDAEIELGLGLGDESFHTNPVWEKE